MSNGKLHTSWTLANPTSQTENYTTMLSIPCTPVRSPATTTPHDNTTTQESIYSTYPKLQIAAQQQFIQESASTKLTSEKADDPIRLLDRSRKHTRLHLLACLKRATTTKLSMRPELMRVLHNADHSHHSDQPKALQDAKGSDLLHLA
eukprot:488815-Amphidinium_carterae.1